MQHKNKQQSKFNELLTQIKHYLKIQDHESLKFLLEDETQEKLKYIRNNLSNQQKTIFDQIVNQKQCKYPNDFECKIDKKNDKIKAIIQNQQLESSEEDLQFIEREFKITNIQFGKNFSYPFINLLEKMVLVYFQKTHPHPIPEASLKMLHSQIQTLFTYIFDNKIKNQIISKKNKSKKQFINSLKDYIFYIFESEYQRFIRFHKMFKNIKSSLSQKQQEAINEEKQNKLNYYSPLTASYNLEEMEYLAKISEQIKNEQQFRQFSKIKSLNFLYFGQKKLIQLIDPNNNFFTDNLPKQIYQLISFIVCRFLRKIILECISRKNSGKLQFLNSNQQIQPMDVKIVGNQLIDKYKKKSEDYIKLEEPIENIAKRIFIQEFYEYDYESVIPKHIIDISQKSLEAKIEEKQNLPENIWNNFKQYKVQWIQRIAAEQYISELDSEKLSKQKGKNNEYAKFIMKNMNDYEKNSTLLWLKYLTMNHSNFSIQSGNESNQKEEKQVEKNEQWEKKSKT